MARSASPLPLTNWFHCLTPSRRRISRRRSRCSNWSSRKSLAMSSAYENCESQPVRCGWANGGLLLRYHDEEWGVAVHEDRKLFEFLILEGAQAGLSWNTILNKREHYPKAFEGFDPQRVARYDRRKVERLLRDPGIVRNQLKISSAIANARAFLRIQEEFGS